jgi:TonB family protein
MSGRPFKPDLPVASPVLRLLCWPHGTGEEAFLRLGALAASCLLHAALMTAPYLGERIQGERLMVKGEHRPPRVFNVFLTSTGDRRSSTEHLSGEGEHVPGFSLSERVPGGVRRAEADQTAGAGLLPVPGLAYYTTDRLTRRPQPLFPADLEPPELRPIIASGNIIVKLWISDRGEVAEVEVERSEMPPTFVRAAVAAFKRVRFSPGELNGRPVGTVMRVEVNYDDFRTPPH